MNWTALWMDLFGTADWMGLSLSFWMAMAAVTLVVIAMNAITWGMRPKDREVE